MRPLLLDTNAYTGFKRGDKAIIEIIQSVDALIMSPIVLGELQAGFDGGNKAKDNRTQLQEFLESSRIKIFPITQSTSLFFSQIFASLKRKGKPIPTNDMWIGAQALEHGCIVCTLDKHFQEIEGLVVASSISDLLF